MFVHKVTNAVQRHTGKNSLNEKKANFFLSTIFSGIKKPHRYIEYDCKFVVVGGGGDMVTSKDLEILTSFRGVNTSLIGLQCKG